MVAQFLAIKSVEWEKYVAAVDSVAEARDRITDWENSTYLPYI